MLYNCANYIEAEKSHNNFQYVDLDAQADFYLHNIKLTGLKQQLTKLDQLLIMVERFSPSMNAAFNQAVVRERYGHQ